MNNNRIKAHGADKVFLILNTFLAILFLLVALYPLVFVVSASFSSGLALTQGRVWLFPIDFTLSGYTTILNMPPITSGFVNSVFYTLLGTVINIIFTIMAAYPLSRKDFQAKKPITMLFMFTMLFSGGMIPSFLLIQNLHLQNSVWALVLPGAVSVWNMIIVMNFFRSNIPDELLEAAQLDGCGDIRFLTSFVIPLSKSIIAVIGLFYAVSHWNSYFGALLYLSSPSKYPLPLVLRDILILNSVQNMASGMDIMDLIRRQNVQDLLKYSVIVVSTLPMMIIYPFMQKHLIKGVMVGSVKG